MRRWKLTTRTAAVAIAACLLCFTPAEAKKPDKPPGGGGKGGSVYTIVPFNPPGMDSLKSGVGDLNEMGHAVGGVERTDGTHQAVHLDLATGVYSSLLGGVNTSANDVNNLNQIVGKNGDVGAFWKNPAAAPVALPPLPGHLAAGGTQISDDGIVIGGSDDDFLYPGTPVVWRVVVDKDGVASVDGPHPLPPLPGGTVSWGAAITEIVDGRALVVGRSFDGSDHAVVWTVELNADGTLAAPGPPVPLGTLGLRNPSSSAASGVNDFGDVSGTSDRRPFIAPNGGELKALPVPRDTLDANALDINDVGESVGYVQIQFKGSNVLDGPHYAYLWRNGKAIDLAKQIPKRSGWDYLTWAGAINNAGLIAGFGRFDVARRGFILIPNTP